MWDVYYKHVLPALEKEDLSTVLPRRSDWFNAFEVDPDKIRVVLLSQDPYPTKGVAHGYAFSVQPHCTIPPSLRNVLREYSDDLGYKTPRTGDLRAWAQRGVFLFNTALTVQEGKAGTHLSLWSRLTYEVLSQLSHRRTGIVFMLWGKEAQQYRGLIDETKHLVLTAAHPSPINTRGGFLGCKHFSKACEYLNVTPEELWKLSG